LRHLRPQWSAPEAVVGRRQCAPSGLLQSQTGRARSCIQRPYLCACVCIPQHPLKPAHRLLHPGSTLSPTASAAVEVLGVKAVANTRAVGHGSAALLAGQAAGVACRAARRVKAGPSSASLIFHAAKPNNAVAAQDVDGVVCGLGYKACCAAAAAVLVGDCVGAAHCRNMKGGGGHVSEVSAADCSHFWHPRWAKSQCCVSTWPIQPPHCRSGSYLLGQQLHACMHVGAMHHASHVPTAVGGSHRRHRSARPCRGGMRRCCRLPCKVGTRPCRGSQTLGKACGTLPGTDRRKHSPSTSPDMAFHPAQTWCNSRRTSCSWVALDPLGWSHSRLCKRRSRVPCIQDHRLRGKDAI
jgi:hypothetical protein